MYTHFADLDSRLIILSQLEGDDRLTDVVTSILKTGKCPKCQHDSHKRHSAHMRIIDNLPIQGKRPIISENQKMVLYERFKRNTSVY